MPLEKEQNSLSFRISGVTEPSVGEVYLALDNPPAALQVFRNALAQRNKVIQAKPDNVDDRRNLSLVHGRIAKALQAMSDLDGALSAQEKGLAIAEQQAEAKPENRSLQRDLYVSNDSIARILRQQHRFDAANAVFRRNIALTKAIAAKHASNEQAPEDFSNAIDAFGGTAYHAVLAHDFEEALEIADEAIALAPGKIWLNSNRAHALMFLGREDEAREIYLKYRGVEKALGDRAWDDVILTDFTEIRQSGIDHPLMGEIEAAFGAPSHAGRRTTAAPETTETVQ